MNNELFKKMSAEQIEFKSWLLRQPPADILDHANEYAVREDILMEMEELNLPDAHAEALLSVPDAMSAIYKEYAKLDDTYHMETVQDCIESCAEMLHKTQENPFKPLYTQSKQYANEHGEIERYLVSRMENMACKKAIDMAIQKGFDGYRLEDGVEKNVLNRYGAERVSHVLASTIQAMNYDPRFSPENKQWAASIPMLDSVSERQYYRLESHPGILDVFAKCTRKEIDAMKEQPEKKPSVREQLGAKPEQESRPDSHAKSKKHDAR